MICKKCGKEFDPAYDFVEGIEEAELLVAIDGHLAEKCCSSCGYDFINQLYGLVNKFFGDELEEIEEP